MQQFLALFRLFREYVVVTVLAALSIILIAGSDAAPVRVLRSVAISLFASVQASTNLFSSSFSTRYENESLRDVNMGLMEEVMQLRRLRLENAELRRMLDFDARSSSPLLAAEVVGRTYTLGQSTLTINRGSDDSVQVNMPVITERGLVGKVIGTSAGYAVVQLAVNREFRASAKVQRSRVDGIIAWNDGISLQMQNIWKTADVVVGDTIVTSELSNTYPPEIPIGIIASIGPGEGGLFSHVAVTPSVDFTVIERVFVVRYMRDIERETLERRMRGGGSTQNP